MYLTSRKITGCPVAPVFRIMFRLVLGVIEIDLIGLQMI